MGRHLSKDSVVQTLRTVAAMTGARTTTPNLDGSMRQRFCGHVLRVAGAQGFARANVQLNVIKLIGRWGSDAVERYVQDAPLATSHMIASAVATAMRPTRDQGPHVPAHAVQDAEEETASETDDLALPISVEDDMMTAPQPLGDMANASSTSECAEMPENMRLVINASSGIAHWDYIRTDQEVET